MEEIWKDIPGYEGIYQISNLARVKRNTRFSKIRGGESKIISERILKIAKPKSGYFQLALSLNGKLTPYYLHRILAQAFIPNPNEYPIINHINGIRDDCRIENLEWCTYSYNTRDEMKRNNRNPIVNFKGLHRTKKYRYNNKPVIQFYLVVNFIKLYWRMSQSKKYFKKMKLQMPIIINENMKIF